MRTYAHVIDTKAIKRTLNSIPDHWVVRELTERDYGIDLLLEIFSQTGLDKKGHAIYNSTGHICHLQIKGTNSPIELNQDNTISFSVEKTSLLYMEKSPVPFLLVRACTLPTTAGAYFVWIQRYILDVLDVQMPDWRTNDQETHTVRIPSTNYMPNNTAKIEKIAARLKYIEEHSEFYERYSIMRLAYKNMINKSLPHTSYNDFIQELKRIKTFGTLFNWNNRQIDASDIEDLIKYVQDVQGGTETPKSTSDFPGTILFNLDLLESDNFLRIHAENIIAENENDTVY